MSELFDNFHLLTSKQRAFLLKDSQILAQMVQSNVDQERYIHSLGVAQLAMYLAMSHHIDPQKAYIAGLLHDVTKSFSEEENDAYFKYYEPDKLNYPSKVKHSFSAKYYLKEKLHFHDKDILNAIYNHTILNSKDKLSMILYIADKREINRGINDNIVQIAQTDLSLAVKLLQEYWQKNRKNS